MISTIYCYAAKMMTLTAASVNIDGTIGEAEHFIDHFFLQIAENTKYNGTHLILNLIFLLVCFSIRYRYYFQIVNIDTSTDDGKKLYSRYRSYVINHILLSAVFAFVICYLLIKMANTAEIVIVWNVIIAPLIGYLSSIWFDKEFLVKSESKYKFLRNPLNEKDKDPEGPKDDHHTEVHVVVNNGESHTDDKFVLDGDKSLSDSQKLEATINRIIEVQKEQSEILSNHTAELKEQNLMLTNMQQLMKNNVKFDLEDKIYEVITRGYVTPSEDRRIRAKFIDYTNNKGNGDLEELYRNRYLELEVREKSF